VRLTQCRIVHYARGYQTVGRELFLLGTFIFNEIWAQDKTYILAGTLLG
jgi:hypothetical protein